MNENAMSNTSKTDWARVDAMTDEDIDTSDIAPLSEEFFAKAKWRIPEPNELASNVLNLQHRFFLVDERPLCIWDKDIRQKTLKFLENIDSGYFDYIVNVHLQTLNQGDKSTDKESQYAALALRTAYSQALETLFALICAAIQAPWCVPAWINAYKNDELRQLVEKIHTKKPIRSLLGGESPSWSSICAFIFQQCPFENEAQKSSVEAGFAQLWSNFAQDFLDKEHSQEYNSIKHGLRVRSGGFKFSVGLLDKPDVPPPADKMEVVSDSQFGSSFLVNEKIGSEKHHIYFKEHCRNWNPKDIALRLMLASISISNIQSTLKLMHGVSEVQLQYPEDFTYVNHWNDFAAVTTPKIQIISEFIIPFTKEEISSGYKTIKGFGVRKIIFTNKEEVANND
ncbi:hypothetical protein H6F98_20140 [Microcoleus sp. FACHB-SPT15]|uniref:hypothetical protein n=1 Tax=Microcoleus sp. FACHB-SPT15 TaxID=2692830 RepID=UPI0017839543|nr:hypothetical protein [Microcoleus sp. FACHB-SPT15]MBD1807740.1 hypothetical protein [Microcoleus sp. FACHB-SPT15]